MIFNLVLGNDTSLLALELNQRLVEGSLPSNSRTALDCASIPALSERDLFLIYQICSRKIFYQVRSGGQIPKWDRYVIIRCKWDDQRGEPLGNGDNGPGMEHVTGGKELQKFTDRGKVSAHISIRRYLACD